MSSQNCRLKCHSNLWWNFCHHRREMKTKGDFSMSLFMLWHVCLLLQFFWNEAKYQTFKFKRKCFWFNDTTCQCLQFLPRRKRNTNCQHKRRGVTIFCVCYLRCHVICLIWTNVIFQACLEKKWLQQPLIHKNIYPGKIINIFRVSRFFGQMARTHHQSDASHLTTLETVYPPKMGKMGDHAIVIHGLKLCLFLNRKIFSNNFPRWQTHTSLAINVYSESRNFRWVFLSFRT